MASDIPQFPFAAVAGQNQFKLALLMAAINPAVGGVLVSGPRGSAKSTLAKGLSQVLPQQTSEANFVALPLGASEEMLIGTLNLQQVLDEKKIQFQDGLLAKANGGVLYVDEVNLLPDNLVDHLLDVAASGENIVERDGISHRHAAEFLLLGTMNPDEGELRPQLQDRFGLAVLLDNQYSVEERVEIVRLREAFDADPLEFIESYVSEQNELRAKISAARNTLNTVQCDNTMRLVIAERCAAARVDGLRADIVWLQSARAHAALMGRSKVEKSDIDAVESLVLNHRRRDDQPPQSPSSKAPNENKPFSRPNAPNNQQKSDSLQNSSSNENVLEGSSAEGDWGAMSAEEHSATDLNIQLGLTPAPKSLQPKATHRAFASEKQRNRENGSAGGDRTSTSQNQTVHWFRTLTQNFAEWPLKKLVFQSKRTGQQTLHLIVLDTSASVLASQSFAKAKGSVMRIVESAYLRRERLAIVGFGNQRSELLLPARRAPKDISKFLDELTAGGGTPLLQGLADAHVFQTQQLRQYPSLEFKNYLVTDGRVRQLPDSMQLHGHTVLIDVEQSAVKRGKSQTIASLLGAQYLSLAQA